MLKENAPDIVRAVVLLQADLSVHSAYLRAAETAGRQFGTAVIAAEVRNVADIERAVTALAAEPRSSLIVLPIRSTSSTAIKLSHWQRVTAFLRSIRYGFLPMRVG